MVTTRGENGKLPRPNTYSTDKSVKKAAPRRAGKDVYDVLPDSSQEEVAQAKPAQKVSASTSKRKAQEPAADDEQLPKKRGRGRPPKDQKKSSTTSVSPNKTVDAEGNAGAKAGTQAPPIADGSAKPKKAKKAATQKGSSPGQGKKKASDKNMPEDGEAQGVEGTSLDNQHIESTDQQANEEMASDIDEDLEHLQDSLFGHYAVWKRVRKSQRKLVKLIGEKNFKIKTEEAKTIYKITDKLCVWYEDHQVHDDAPTAATEEQQRKEYHASLEKALKNFRASSEQNRDLYRDFYTFVVPSYVDVLHGAIECRVGAWAEEVILPELEEVLSLLRPFVALCNYLRVLSNGETWSAAAIKRPTSQVIYPSCKTLQDILSAEYNRQRLQQGYMMKNLEARREEFERKKEAAKEAHRKKIEEQRAATAASIERFSSPKKPAYMEIPTRELSPPAQISTSNSGWTEDQDDRLLIELSYRSHLPNNERYDQCLLCEQLQNKSAELIRERAILYKGIWETYCGEKGVEIPPWVTSIS